MNGIRPSFTSISQSSYAGATQNKATSIDSQTANIEDFAKQMAGTSELSPEQLNAYNNLVQRQSDLMKSIPVLLR